MYKHIKQKEIAAGGSAAAAERTAAATVNKTRQLVLFEEGRTKTPHKKKETKTTP